MLEWATAKLVLGREGGRSEGAREQEGEEGLEDEESGRPADLVYGMMSNLRRSRKGA